MQCMQASGETTLESMQRCVEGNLGITPDIVEHGNNKHVEQKEYLQTSFVLLHLMLRDLTSVWLLNLFIETANLCVCRRWSKRTMNPKGKHSKGHDEARPCVFSEALVTQEHANC
eukprot:1255768-Amphidinium_carterae.1